MNIAFPAALILMLILPGAIFRYCYARGSWWSSPVSFRTISDELAYSAVFAVGLHVLWLLVAAAFEYRADFHSLVALLTGNFGHQNARYESALNSVAGFPGAIASYFLTLFAAAAVGGRSAHSAVRHFGLDLSTQVLRFKNEWHYLLTGEALRFKELNLDTRAIDGVLLSAVVDHGKECYLYRGLVADWSLDKDGQLEVIRLRFTHRRALGEDRSTDSDEQPGAFVPLDDRYYEIRGDIFVLRYAEMRTINLDYFALSDPTAVIDEQHAATSPPIAEEHASHAVPIGGVQAPESTYGDPPRKS